MDEAKTVYLLHLLEIEDVIVSTSAALDSIIRAAAVLSENFGDEVEPLINCLIQHLSALEDRLDTAQFNPVFNELHKVEATS